MISAYLVSATLMGLLAVGILVAVGRGPRWYDYRPETAAGSSLLARWNLWIVVGAITVLGAVAGAIVVLLGLVPLTTMLIAYAGGLVVLYVLLGMYITARQRGHSNALAAAETATVAGTLFLLAVTAQLLGG